MFAQGVSLCNQCGCEVLLDDRSGRLVAWAGCGGCAPPVLQLGLALSASVTEPEPEAYVDWSRCSSESAIGGRSAQDSYLDGGDVESWWASLTDDELAAERETAEAGEGGV
jgi:hypothetical protein